MTTPHYPPSPPASPIVLIDSPDVRPPHEDLVVLIETDPYFACAPDVFLLNRDPTLLNPPSAPTSDSAATGSATAPSSATLGSAATDAAATDSVGAPSSQSRRKRGRRAVPYEYTAPPSAGEPKYASVSVIGRGVVVKPSSILESGNGLFADRDFRKGELITEYYGEILDRDEVELRCQLGQFQYIGTLRPQQYYIDGIRVPQEGMGGASFINHAAVVNSVWHEVEDRRICFTRKFARASRDIRRGEEIFVNYGKTYWSRMRRWHDTIEREGLDNISDFEGEVECECDYTDYLKQPNIPPAVISRAGEGEERQAAKAAAPLNAGACSTHPSPQLIN